MMNSRAFPMRRAVVGLFLIFGCIILAGCDGGRRRQSEAREGSHLKPLSLFYGQYIGQHQGQPPENEEQFREFVQSLGPEQLASFGINDLESLFVSERDGKPYVILYGSAALSGPPGPAAAPVIAYEQEGLEGQRFVASNMGAVEEVDPERFRKLVPDAE